MTTYFNTLPKELLLIITSKLIIPDLSFLRKVDYNFIKLLNNDVTYRELLKRIVPEFYMFMIGIKNVDGCGSWKEVYEYIIVDVMIEHIMGSSEDIDTYNVGSVDMVAYLYEIRYLYRTKLKFPEFYDQVKDINLDHIGDDSTPPSWYDIFYGLEKYSHYPFVRGNFSKNNYDNLLENRTGGSEELNFIRLCIYIHTKHGGAFSLYTLFDFFRFNTDIYEEIKYKPVTTGVSLLELRRTAVRDKVGYLFDMFEYDIKK